jgi:DNA-binding transcriptional MerR regulator
MAHGAHTPGSPVREGIPIGYQGGNLRHVAVEEFEQARLAGRGYSGPIACAVVGITYRQLDYWARTDLLRPSREAHGSGSRRVYSEDDIRILRIIKAMLDLGISLHVVRRVVEGFDGTAPEHGSLLVYRASDGDAVVVSPEGREEIFEMIAQGPCVALMIE